MSRPNGVLLGIDADPAALAAAREHLAPFGDRVTLVEAYYDRLARVATDTGFRPANGILFDLGVSSAQLDVAARGFSFQQDAPLDMRFGPGARQTAADIVNLRSAEELQQIFQEYGEERHARWVAQRIVEARSHAPITTTGRLAEIVARAKPGAGHERIHPATRVFQALRIAVNDELERLRLVLPQTLDVLAVGGRLAVISFHSLEDRIVKQFIQRESRDCICPPGLPACACGHVATLRAVTRRPIVATTAEIAANVRSRSAKLRVAERIA